jgi:GT2 family glycosyltransferase
MIVRREAMEKTGLLDEDYFLFLEETDWCYRMKKNGWRIYHVPHAEIIHFQGKTANRVKPEAKIEYYRSLYIFFRKHKGNAQSQFLKVFLFIRFCADFILSVFSCLLTAFQKEKLKGKMAMYAKLIYWHMKRCPEGMGLKGKPAG